MSDLYWLSATTVGNHFKIGLYVILSLNVFISKSTRSVDKVFKKMICKFMARGTVHNFIRKQSQMH